MTVRLTEPNIYNTETLLGQVLAPLVREDSRVMFLCDPSSGPAVVQRLRVMISRKRRELEKRGKNIRRFRLHCSIHPETHDGKRYDCVVMWKSVNEVHLMSEDLEDMLSNG